MGKRIEYLDFRSGGPEIRAYILTQSLCFTNNNILYEQVLHGNNLWESSGELVAL